MIPEWEQVIKQRTKKPFQVFSFQIVFQKSITTTVTELTNAVRMSRRHYKTRLIRIIVAEWKINGKTTHHGDGTLTMASARIYWKRKLLEVMKM